MAKKSTKAEVKPEATEDEIIDEIPADTPVVLHPGLKIRWRVFAPISQTSLRRRMPKHTTWTPCLGIVILLIGRG